MAARGEANNWQLSVSKSKAVSELVAEAAPVAQGVAMGVLCFNFVRHPDLAAAAAINMDTS